MLPCNFSVTQQMAT